MRTHTYDDMVRAAKAVEEAENRLQEARRQALQANEQLRKEREKEEQVASEIGYARGQLWVAKSTVEDAYRCLVRAREEHVKLITEAESRERLAFLNVDSDAIDFLLQSHQPPVYNVERNRFKSPSTTQLRFIRDFEKYWDCTIFFVIEQHFPFPKESDDIHPTTSYLFFDNNDIRDECCYRDNRDYLDGCDEWSTLSMGDHYTYAYVESPVSPHRTITEIAVDTTDNGGLRRCTYSECQVKYEEMSWLWEYIASKYDDPSD